jgi:hypothetical protein
VDTRKGFIDAFHCYDFVACLCHMLYLVFGTYPKIQEEFFFNFQIDSL